MKASNAAGTAERDFHVARGLQTPRGGGRLIVQNSDETVEVKPTAKLRFGESFTVTNLGDEIALVSGGGGDTGDGTGNTGNLVSVVTASGSSQTLDASAYALFDITLTANCTFTFAGAEDGVAQIQVILRQGGAGGWTVTWPSEVVWMDPATGLAGGSAPTLFTAVDSQSNFNFVSLDAGLTWGGDMTNDVSGSASPLTTKGDLWGYDTADARVPVGANGYLLTADSTDAQGVVWENPETTGHYEVLMTGASPAEPLEDGSGTDWLYVWVS